MLRINLNTKDFENRTFDKSELVKTYKNGSKDYLVKCNCNDCSGRGYLSWTNVDGGRCWKCNATGKVQAIIHVSDSCKKELTREQVLENIRKADEECRNYFLSLGYKPVDFEIAEWSGVWFNSDSYYRIIKETEKAYLLGRVDNLTSRNCEITFWVPKKAITFKGGK